MTSSPKGRTCARAEDVRRFCRGLIEEAEAGEGGVAEGPELAWGKRKGRGACVQHKGHILWIRLRDAVVRVPEPTDMGRENILYREV